MSGAASCDPFREALSARLDGEDEGLAPGVLQAHLAGCPRCTGWAEAAAAVTRRARVATAPPIPDLTAAVLTALPGRLPVPAVGPRSRLVAGGLRVALLLVALAQAGLAWPSLAHGVGAMNGPVHMAHETGAWNAALSVAFLAVAAAPRLAPGALPFLGSFVAVLTVVTSLDLLAGRVGVGRAAEHLLLLTGLVLVAVVAWRGRRPRPVRTAGLVRTPAPA